MPLSNEKLTIQIGSQLSLAARLLAAEGHTADAQAIVFIDHAIQQARNELEVARLRWLRDHVRALILARMVGASFDPR
jgi:hypothetical protein